MKNLLLLIVAVLILSCQKSSLQTKNIVQKNLSSIEQFYKFLNDENKGGLFQIQVTSPIANKEQDHKSVSISGGFLDKKSHTIIAPGECKIESIKLTPSPHGGNEFNMNLPWQQGKMLFGKKLKLSLNRNSGTSNSTRNNLNGVETYETGYMPLAFDCTNEFQMNLMDPDGHFITGNKVNQSFAFNWIPDESNEKGVFIFIEYDPLEKSNSQFRNTGYSERRSNGILVDDNGSYTLARDLFDDIPEGGMVKISIGRGNYEYLVTEDGDVTDLQIFSLSYQYGEFWYTNN